jgi:hypothetical protein
MPRIVYESICEKAARYRFPVTSLHILLLAKYLGLGLDQLRVAA